MKIDRDMALKIGLGVVAVIVGLAALQFVVGLAAQILPLAVLAVLGYVGYRVLSSRIGRAPQQGTRRREEAAAPARQAAAPARQAAAAAPQQAEPAAEDKEPLDYDELKEAETRIARLEEKEKQQPQVTDAVRAQIEERRRRLGGGSGK